MGWSDLPADLVAAVADRLGTEIADLLRFRSVCRPWRSGSAAHAARLRVPLLLIPMMSDDTSTERLVWSFADDRLREAPLPEGRGGHSFVFASHHGWILTVVTGDGGLKATLVYHFTGISEQLPRLPSSFGGDGGGRVALGGLSWDWSPQGVVVSSPGKGAFFCRPGDGSWRSVGCPSAAVTSVTACDGALYLFDRKACSATVVDAGTLDLTAVIEPPALEIATWERKEMEANLVVCPDELILLVRSKLHHPWCSGWPRFCKAFRADPRAVTGGRSPSWSEVAGIGDRAVFVDSLRAFCVEANGHNGLRRNCVYVAGSYHAVDDDYDYSLDRYGRMYSVAVLDFASHTTESLSFGSLVKLWSAGDGQCPSWLMPSYCSTAACTDGSRNASQQVKEETQGDEGDGSGVRRPVYGRGRGSGIFSACVRRSSSYINARGAACPSQVEFFF